MRIRGTHLPLWAVPTLLLGMTSAGNAAVDDATKCEAAKNKIAGKYALCLAKELGKALKKNEATDFSSCVEKFNKLWNTPETKWARSCPEKRRRFIT